ncbi:hypothetical protein B9Z65_3235 [Elsinoe australis]|uniref:C2H2-type domain-containing protein n=1 Tax=Elsinoe australis TaxID=40998 RepID=A0A2P7ZUT6_9PEZI|nr:hypothetical protein B9Z65_3235 [Elsinoe australis]
MKWYMGVSTSRSSKTGHDDRHRRYPDRIMHPTPLGFDVVLSLSREYLAPHCSTTIHSKPLKGSNAFDRTADSSRVGLASGVPEAASTLSSAISSQLISTLTFTTDTTFYSSTSHTTAILASNVRNSPPSLYNSPVIRDRESTFDDSPVSTPPPPSHRTTSAPRSAKVDAFGPLFSQQHPFQDTLFGGGASSEELIFLGDDDFGSFDSFDPHIPLPAPPRSQPTMAAAASPIDIATPRNSPPVTQTSNLTSQLQSAGAQQYQQNGHRNNYNDTRRGSEFKPESLGYGHSMSNSRPIAVGERQRRGSNQPGNSFMQGMSWGGMSIGSFIRDDIMMGTSPFNFQSPSFHSSSYLPKMEANFMRDYVCCGITLDSMHELLQHYEEAHAGVPNQTMGRTPRDQQAYNEARPQDNVNAAALMQQQQQHQTNGQGSVQPTGLTHPMQSNTDMDDLDAMEMDEAPAVQPVHNFQPQPQFGRQQPRTPTLNTSLASGFQNSQMSTPTTPQPNQSFGLQHNPTVSSVNTPTFGQTVMDSVPTSPSDFSGVDTPRASQGEGFDYSGLGMNPNDFGTIDDPAKRLLSKQGFGNINQMQNQSDIAKRIRESQISAGMDPAAFNFGSDEIKPFRCPVIGCEKAYKNQNGLKYHKQHGHQNQQLKENPDGTFSIVDPATSIPYPGTIGMEKEKPYRCEVCGKRYKNLNGLKYHRQHSPPCNPDLKINPAMNMSNNLNGMNVNVAGAGLVGDGMGM